MTKVTESELVATREREFEVPYDRDHDSNSRFPDRMGHNKCVRRRYDCFIAPSGMRRNNRVVGICAMTLEEFANVHELPEHWLSLRRECEALVCHPQYWYRPDMQNAARMLAVEASDILHARLKRSERRKISCHDEPTMLA